jgi:putative ubiquitin-RnfH superfamily antitoxin RatB of RatAB toxin-antitoxin module
MPAMQITVMYSPMPRVVHEKTLTLDEGVTVLQAIEASGLQADCPEMDVSRSEDFAMSVWGRKATPDQALRHLDRVEICRALTVDPKVARRERFQKQGSRGAGLFSKRRPGAKPGY